MCYMTDERQIQIEFEFSCTGKASSVELTVVMKINAFPNPLEERRQVAGKILR